MLVTYNWRTMHTIRDRCNLPCGSGDHELVDELGATWPAGISRRLDAAAFAITRAVLSLNKFLAHRGGFVSAAGAVPDQTIQLKNS